MGCLPMTKLIVEKDMSLRIPAEVISEFNLSPGESICLEVSDERIVITRKIDESEIRMKVATRNLQSSILNIKGIGQKLQGLLARKNIRTVEDALFCLPIRYEDRREIVPISSLRVGRTQVFEGVVVSAESLVTRGGRRFFEVIASDNSGKVSLKWFNANPLWMKRTWVVGRKWVFIGDVSSFGHQVEVHHPDVEWLGNSTDANSAIASDPENFGRIVPVYPLTEGLNQRSMRKFMRNLLEQFRKDIISPIPLEYLKKTGFLPLSEAIEQLHLPDSDAILSELNEGRTDAHRSIAFDEFFFWELGLALKRKGITLENGIAFEVTHRYTKELARILPFQLTSAQRRVLSEIKNDMMAPHPMHRLVQGDVGSGKTIVALMSALLAVENGYQVAIMAPTEILAEQHWHNIHGWCERLGISVVLLTSGIKGKEKANVLSSVSDGSASIVIGTHSVIQDKVKFFRLGLGIIDEQHRFGVLQRGVLKAKGTNPDILVMTATPIPRTLAMTLFGDLSLSAIDELPPGRISVKTSVCYESRRKYVYETLRSEIEKGRQAYIIYPLVEESEKSDLKAASQMAEKISQEVFPDLRIALLHGRMKPEEKEQVMVAFKNREIDILVATTVIEVGIDVPNATVMVIEHAERFGLSQLHQLRGRVGRGGYGSVCILMTSGKLSEEIGRASCRERV